MDRSTHARRTAPTQRRRGRALVRGSSVAAIGLGSVLAFATVASAAVPIQVIGHRGGTDGPPESSLDAIRHALGVKADAVELDIRFTEDRVPVVMHDATFERTTVCRGLVNEVYLSTFRRCTLDVQNGSRAGQAPPSLDDALKVLAPSKVKIYVHVKEGSAGQAKSIVAALNKYGLNTTSSASNRSVVFTDAGKGSLLANLKKAGAKRIGTIVNTSAGWSAPYQVIIPYGMPLTRALVAKAQAAGKFVVAVEGKPVRADQAAALGLNGFMANDLDAFLVRSGRMAPPPAA